MWTDAFIPLIHGNVHILFWSYRKCFNHISAESVLETTCVICGVWFDVSLQARVSLYMYITGTGSTRVNTLCRQHQWQHATPYPVSPMNCIWCTSNISRAKSQNLNVSCLVLKISLPNPLKPCVKNEGVVGAAPTGYAPTTSEWSRILLPILQYSF